MAAPDTVLPVACLHDDVVFPGEVRTLVVEHPAVRAVFEAHPEPDTRVVLAYAEDGRAGADLDGCLAVGTEARVLDRVALDDDALSVVVQGIERVKLGPVVSPAPALACHIERLPDPSPGKRRPTLRAKQLIGLYERLIDATDRHPKGLLGVLRHNQGNLERLPDLLGAGLQVEYGLRLGLIEAETTEARFDAAVALLRGEFDRIQVGKEVDKKTKREIDESRREYFLRQQL
ncbi:MAG: LON peptidase substrate-binding domain-containing protein, partial [Myxococcales bacterium]|nr:LON peptidase substrate-binding domain-containing protein [Myxococcales bacterium]